jgi:predicted lysophospholipase L1 biosynthesis ABC-type transport system permease subunit
MPIHWSYKSLPELSTLPAAERKEVWKRAVWRAAERWQTWLVFPIAFILVVPVTCWLGLMFGDYLLGIAAGGIIASAIYGRVVFHIARWQLKTIISRPDEG